tara:strand:- start:877 stop:3465 length:2589 start_codon:yes stop_codon:yes gene_type:complete
MAEWLTLGNVAKTLAPTLLGYMFGGGGGGGGGGYSPMQERLYSAQADIADLMRRQMLNRYNKVEMPYLGRSMENVFGYGDHILTEPRAQLRAPGIFEPTLRDRSFAPSGGTAFSFSPLDDTATAYDPETFGSFTPKMPAFDPSWQPVIDAMTVDPYQGLSTIFSPLTQAIAGNMANPVDVLGAAGNMFQNPLVTFGEGAVQGGAANIAEGAIAAPNLNIAEGAITAPSMTFGEGAFAGPQYAEGAFAGPQYAAPDLNIASGAFAAPDLNIASGAFAAPTYQAPSYQAPVFEAPQAPVYNAPDYQAPVYDAPDYQAPVYDAPDYQAPVYDAPDYQAPVYDAPEYAFNPVLTADLSTGEVPFVDVVTDPLDMVIPDQDVVQVGGNISVMPTPSLGDQLVDDAVAGTPGFAHPAFAVADPVDDTVFGTPDFAHPAFAMGDPVGDAVSGTPDFAHPAFAMADPVVAPVGVSVPEWMTSEQAEFVASLPENEQAAAIDALLMMRNVADRGTAPSIAEADLAGQGAALADEYASTMPPPTVAGGEVDLAAQGAALADEYASTMPMAAPDLFAALAAGDFSGLADQPYFSEMRPENLTPEQLAFLPSIGGGGGGIAGGALAPGMTAGTAHAGGGSGGGGGAGGGTGSGGRYTFRDLRRDMIRNYVAQANPTVAQALDWHRQQRLHGMLGQGEPLTDMDAQVLESWLEENPLHKAQAAMYGAFPVQQLLDPDFDWERYNRLNMARAISRGRGGDIYPDPLWEHELDDAATELMWRKHMDQRYKAQGFGETGFELDDAEEATLQAFIEDRLGMFVPGYEYRPPPAFWPEDRMPPELANTEMFGKTAVPAGHVPPDMPEDDQVYGGPDYSKD